MSENLSSSLAHYLSAMTAPGRAASPSVHLERGGDCIQPADLARLRALEPALLAKADQLAGSPRLHRRLGLLRQFLQESPDETATAAHREAAFALYYFLKGYDLIPDTIPEVGLLDDALLIETVLHRNALELRDHWAAHGRTWPDNA